MQRVLLYIRSSRIPTDRHERDKEDEEREDRGRRRGKRRSRERQEGRLEDVGREIKQ